MNIFKRIINHYQAPKRQKEELLRWAATIDPTKEGQKRIVADYNTLHELNGLSTEEYYQFEFEKRDEPFHQGRPQEGQHREKGGYIHQIAHPPLQRHCKDYLSQPRHNRSGAYNRWTKRRGD